MSERERGTCALIVTIEQQIDLFALASATCSLSVMEASLPENLLSSTCVTRLALSLVLQVKSQVYLETSLSSCLIREHIAYSALLWLGEPRPEARECSIMAALQAAIMIMVMADINMSSMANQLITTSRYKRRWDRLFAHKKCHLAGGRRLRSESIEMCCCRINHSSPDRLVGRD